MNTSSILLTLAGAHLLASMSPGANTLLAVRAATRSRQLGLAAAAGFWPAGVLWSCAGLGGIGALLHAMPWVGTTLRVACGAYLVWLGVGMLRAAANASTAGPSSDMTPRDALRIGFFTNLTNPKSLAYFTSIFGAVGAHELPLAVQVPLVFALPSIGFLWYATLVSAVSHPVLLRGYRHAAAWIERGAGAVMMLFGIRLLLGTR